ncbi:hypothetical protein HC028_24745 [Planosporangium flavigriseum]|uniref:Uncharacterized protein n=1 Tax=Planosporangium flavigriseum TaxID=373681 RepID=A0A8J3PQ87_9ACTN|nr:hypothetical protein [Planosporangium flavigriseum]NJC67688.1 hypothetical protein [Planosporangium flavigriseum]GIG75836.1 hypothetical protein Pfl04_42400 [Planosporangium flavigriseum]
MTLVTHWSTVIRRQAGRILIVLLALGFIAAVGWRFAGSADAKPNYAVPQDGRLESKLGVRITQAALVGDGGLVEIRYTVLDNQRASAFQNDVKHPPLLKNEKSGKQAWRAALMKQGHELRPGQTYYILYLNNHNAIKRGDKIEISTGSGKLAHVPVR